MIQLLVLLCDDDRLCCSRGPGESYANYTVLCRIRVRVGTAFPFAFKLVELLCGKAKRDQVREPMMFPGGAY